MDRSKLKEGLWYTVGSNPWRWDPAYLFVTTSACHEFSYSYVLFFLLGSDCIYSLDGDAAISGLIDVWAAPFAEAELCHRLTRPDKAPKHWLPHEGEKGVEDLHKLRSLFAERMAKALTGV